MYLNSLVLDISTINVRNAIEWSKFKNMKTPILEMFFQLKKMKEIFSRFSILLKT